MNPYLKKNREICDAQKGRDDATLLHWIGTATADELPALSLLWLIYEMQDAGRMCVMNALLKRLIWRGLILGYFNLIRKMAIEHISGSAVNYDAKFLIEMTISEICLAIVSRPSTRGVTSWKEFCVTKFLDVIKKLDRHEGLAGSQGRVDVIGRNGKDRIETIPTPNNFEACEMNNLKEALRNALREAIRKGGDPLMMAVAEDQFFSGDRGQITGLPNKEGPPSLEQQLHASSDRINGLKSRALEIIRSKLEEFRR